MNNNIKCPNCGNVLDVENVLAADIEDKFKKEYQEKLNQSIGKLEEDKHKLAEEQRLFEDKKKRENELFADRLKTEMAKLEKEKEEEISKKLSSDFENKIRLLQEEKEKNENKLKEAREKELAYLKKEQALQDRESELELTLQKNLQESRAELTETIRSQEQEKNSLKDQEYQLKLREMEKQLEDQKKLAEEMKRKAEQGSMQMQGEVQELLLEELLKSQFPFDKIEEVGKGVRGADCIMTIRNLNGQECGKIIFESKRTENFGGEWIDKLKADMLSRQADVAVLVTKAMPKDMEQFGEKSGVYICNFKEVKSLTTVLRNAILKLHEVRLSEDNKGDKMVSLYNYLTSQEFRGNWNAMRDGFKNLRSMLQKERDDFEKNWKKKEKQIELIIQNSLQISGSMEGIAGQDAIDLQLDDNEVDNLLEN